MELVFFLHSFVLLYLPFTRVQVKLLQFGGWFYKHFGNSYVGMLQDVCVHIMCSKLISETKKVHIIQHADLYRKDGSKCFS